MQYIIGILRKVHVLMDAMGGLIVRLLYPYCDGEGGAVELAVEEKCAESGDDKVGAVECGGE